MKDVFEGTSATVSVLLTRGKSEAAKTVKVVFTTTGKVKIDPVELSLPAKPFVGKASPVKHKVVFPNVPATEVSYEVHYHFESDGKKLPGPDAWKVWPETVSLTTKKKVDGALQAQGLVVVQLVQGDKKRDTMVPNTGTAMLLLPEPAAFELTVPSPCRFVGWLDGKDKGRERVLEWDIVPYKASISLPIGDSPIRQYVNVGFGNQVKVEVATVTHDSGVSPNQEVFVEVVFTNPTKRGSKDPKPTDADYLKERTVGGLSEVAKSNGDKTWKGKIKTGGDGKASFPVYLGKGGGETCEIKVGSTNTVEDQTIKVETWRKVYIQHVHSGTAKTKAAFPADKRQPVVDCYAAVFIEIEFLSGDRGEDLVYPADMKLGERCGWVDGADIEETAGQQCFVANISGESWQGIAKKFLPTAAPMKDLCINVAAVDLLFEVKNITKSVTANRADDFVVKLKGTDSSTDKDDSFGSLPGGSLYKSRAVYELMKVVNYKKVRDSIQRFDVPPENIKASSKPTADRGTLTITPPDEALRLLKADPTMEASVTCDVMMKVKGGGAAGMNNGQAVILGHGASGDAETLNTIIHELGHAIGMCGNVATLGNKGSTSFVDRLPDYTIHKLRKKDNSPVEDWSYKELTRWYSHRGHQGDHCASGLGDSAYKSWSNLDSVGPRNVGAYKCVIYGQTQFLRTPMAFCSECQDMIKAMEVWIGMLPKQPGA